MKVLVVSGRFGMGHEMAANAICEQFRKLDKDTEIVKKDLLEELYPHISKLIFGGFRLMVEHCHGIYNFIYKMSGKMKVEMQPRGAAIYKKLKKILEKEQPDVIVCTHPMCVKAIASYKEKTGLSTPLVTCITDISMHPEWKADQTDLYLAPTREIKEHLICEGTKAENILVTGIPVRQQFLNMDRNHLENEKKVRKVLVMGGGLGLMPDLRRLLGKLHSMQSVQTIVITGIRFTDRNFLSEFCRKNGAITYNVQLHVILHQIPQLLYKVFRKEFHQKLHFCLRAFPIFCRESI